MPVKSGVRELHDLFVRLKAIQDQLASAPKKIKARQQLCVAKAAEIEATKEQIKKVRTAADTNNSLVKANEYKLVSLKVKLNQAASNREFDALRAQIEADEMANSVLEDEVLAGYERVDRLKAEQTQFESELADLKKAEEKLTRDLQAAEAGLKLQADQLQAQIRDAEGIIPSELSLTYKRTVQAHGPEAFAEVDGTQCQRCFCSLPPQTVVELKAGKILLCKSCSKFMYL